MRLVDHTELVEDPLWPLFGVEVRTPRLTLRYVDDKLAAALARLATAGVHDAATMPFSVPWTDQPSPQLERSAMQYHWRNRAELTPDRWRIPFAVIAAGELVGLTDLGATDFRALREFETGSWLGRAYQGRGIGKEMRLATLTFGFDGLGAELARTAAWHDNAASLGVTRALGYEADGTTRELRRGVPDLQLRFRMSRDRFDAIRRDDIELSGVARARDLLGLR
jgi:RimJ/RimL family protein N-acetyltransferase